jgi:hypothetical protein
MTGIGVNYIAQRWRVNVQFDQSQATAILPKGDLLAIGLMHD